MPEQSPDGHSDNDCGNWDNIKAGLSDPGVYCLELQKRPEMAFPIFPAELKGSRDG